MGTVPMLRPGSGDSLPALVDEQRAADLRSRGWVDADPITIAQHTLDGARREHANAEREAEAAERAASAASQVAAEKARAAELAEGVVAVAQAAFDDLVNAGAGGTSAAGDDGSNADGAPADDVDAPADADVDGSPQQRRPPRRKS